MKSDRELLELAAKAAGLKGRWNREVACIRLLPGKKTPYGMCYSYWDPLADDGAALRLAVKLGLRVFTPDTEPTAVADRYPAGPRSGVDAGGDPYAATRRAIVRVAAEIGVGITPSGIARDSGEGS